MAPNYYKEQEHAFTAIERDIKEGNIPPLVLLCGKEEYLVQWYVDVLVKKYVTDASKAIDLVTLEKDNITFEKTVESIETISLMSERKVVLLPDFPPAEGKSLKTLPEGDMKEFLEYIAHIPEGSLLLITAGEPEDNRKKKNKVRATVEKYGRVYDFQPLKEKQLKSFIEKRFKAAGKLYMPSVISMITAESGYGNKAIDYSLYNLENDLKKILAHCGTADEITAADVSDVITANPENNIFAMLDAIGRNRKDEAFRLLNNLLNAGTPVFNLLRMIVNQLELILTVKEMKQDGVAVSDMQKKLGIHQFRIKKAMTVTGQYSTEHLKRVLMSAYEVDENIKTGRLESSLALEYFVASI